MIIHICVRLGVLNNVYCRLLQDLGRQTCVQEILCFSDDVIFSYSRDFLETCSVLLGGENHNELNIKS